MESKKGRRVGRRGAREGEREGEGRRERGVFVVRSFGRARQTEEPKERKERKTVVRLFAHARTHTHTIERGGGSGLFWSGHHCGL
jgi:hypothetical protein